MVTTICYGIAKEWDSREQAILFFGDAVLATAGSAEAERYANILVKLLMGRDVCRDFEED